MVSIVDTIMRVIPITVKGSRHLLSKMQTHLWFTPSGPPWYTNTCTLPDLPHTKPSVFHRHRSYDMGSTTYQNERMRTHMLFATWLQGIGSILAVVAASAAAYFAWHQFRLDVDKTAKHNASGLIAWWAKHQDGTWGIIIENSSTSTFSMVNVRYCYVAKNQSKAPVDENITLQVVPPGVHFVAVTLNGAETQKLWDRTITIHDRSELHPILYSTRFQVYEITYKAGIGQQWRWSADAGLVLANS